MYVYMGCFLLCFTQAFEERPWFLSVRHHFSVRGNTPLETIKGSQFIIRVNNRLACLFRIGFKKLMTGISHKMLPCFLTIKSCNLTIRWWETFQGNIFIIYHFSIGLANCFSKEPDSEYFRLCDFVAWKQSQTVSKWVVCLYSNRIMYHILYFI